MGVRLAQQGLHLAEYPFDSILRLPGRHTLERVDELSVNDETSHGVGGPDAQVGHDLQPGEEWLSRVDKG